MLKADDKKETSFLKMSSLYEVFRILLIIKKRNDDKKLDTIYYTFLISWLTYLII